MICTNSTTCQTEINNFKTMKKNSFTPKKCVKVENVYELRGITVYSKSKLCYAVSLSMQKSVREYNEIRENVLGKNAPKVE